MKVDVNEEGLWDYYNEKLWSPSQRKKYDRIIARYKISDVNGNEAIKRTAEIFKNSFYNIEKDSHLWKKEITWISRFVLEIECLNIINILMEREKFTLWLGETSRVTLNVNNTITVFLNNIFQIYLISKKQLEIYDTFIMGAINQILNEILIKEKFLETDDFYVIYMVNGKDVPIKYPIYFGERKINDVKLTRSLAMEIALFDRQYYNFVKQKEVSCE